jgi:chemotaxis family two-component system response regulator Rcp1
VADNMTILLAEDNPGDVFLVRRALEKHGLNAELIVVEDGQAALHYLERADKDDNLVSPDLFLVDLNLPRATGSRILLRIKQSRKYGSTPIIVVTSSDSPRDRENAAELGANHYFQKPGDLAGYMQLGGIVRSVMEQMPPTPREPDAFSGPGAR